VGASACLLETAHETSCSRATGTGVDSLQYLRSTVSYNVRPVQLGASLACGVFRSACFLVLFKYVSLNVSESRLCKEMGSRVNRHRPLGENRR